MIKNRIIYSEYCEYRFVMTKAEGSYIWDDAGRKLLDFTSGWNVSNLGWNHPEVVEAFIRQAEKNTYAAMWTADPVQEECAAALTAAYPGMDCAWRVTGGTEANEVAVKLARAATGRTKIIGFKDTYHGQLFASMALGYVPASVTKIQPLVPDFIQMDYPAAIDDETADAKTLATFTSQLEDTLAKKDVAAIFIEPGIVTGWGDCRQLPAGCMELVRKLTTQYGTLMVVDEVGTGFSRIGALFGINHFSVVPDIATFAKGLTNGVGGMGAVLSRAELAKPTIAHANYTSTFGWMPTACASALAVLNIHQRDKVWENSARLGDRLLGALHEQLDPLGVTVRGRGLEVCVNLAAIAGPASDLAVTVEQACRNEGLNIIGNGNDMQLMPPCTITQSELDMGIDILTTAIKAHAKS